MAKKKRTGVDPVVGATIVSIRPMTQAELDNNGWEQSIFNIPMALELSTGAVLFPSSDTEGNDAGCFFGEHKGKSFAYHGC